MSGQASAWALSHGPKASDRCAHFVLVAIASATNSSGEHGYPGIAALIDESTYKRSAVLAALRRLIEEGYIEIEEEGRGRGHATVYRIPGVSDPTWRPRGKVQTLDLSAECADPERVQSETPERSSVEGEKVQNERGTLSCPAEEPNGNSSTGVACLAGSDGEASESGEVWRLCHLLADLVAANGSKPPRVTTRWLTECERLIRIDGRTPDKIERAIRWCQADTFWRSNILSMPTLREKYDQLRLAAMRQTNGSPKKDAAASHANQLAERYARGER